MKPFPFLALLMIASPLLAQKKSELQYEIYQLKKEIQIKDDTIAQLRKQRAANVTRLETADYELVRLREDNANLLERLNRFTSESVTRSESIAKGLETLRTKEQQLLEIRNTIGANDSITIQLLTQLTQLLGKDPSLKVENGSVRFTMNPASFGLSDSIETNPRIGRLNQILTGHQDLRMDVYVPAAGGDQSDDTFGLQNYVLRLRHYYLSRPDLASRVSFVTADKDQPAFTVRIQPDYRSFYLRLRESLK